MHQTSRFQPDAPAPGSPKMTSSPPSPSAKGDGTATENVDQGDGTSGDFVPRRSEATNRGGRRHTRMGEQMGQMVIPQVLALEDRFERHLQDFQDMRKRLDEDSKKKVDKEDFELIAMRITRFEKVDPPKMESRIGDLEREGKHCMTLMERLAEQLRRNEGMAAHKSDVSKVRTEVAALKVNAEKIHAEVKENAIAIFNSNKSVTQMITESKSTFEKTILKVEKEKVGSSELAAVQEGIVKLEASMRDNRTILGEGGGGQELNQVVKRIILNMEDKIMLIEKRIDALIENPSLLSSLPRDTASRREYSPPRTGTRSRTYSALTDADGDGPVQVLTSELATIGQGVSQLKHEIGQSRAEIEHIMEQTHHHDELSQRLRVVIEGIAATADDEGTALSLDRVQVMIAAAARQLVAGNKWVTKEVFDLRFSDLRHECFSHSRQLQTSVDELFAVFAKLTTPSPNHAGSAMRLPKVLPVAEKVPLARQQQYINPVWPQNKGDADEQQQRLPGTAPAAPTSEKGLGGTAPRHTPRRLQHERPGSTGRMGSSG